MRIFPKDWKKYKIKEIGDVLTGNTPSMKDPRNYGNDLVWVKPPDLDKGKYVSTSERKISSIGKQKVRVLPKGSVLVSCIGTIGKVAVADCELCTNQQINSVIPDEKIVDSSFLYYLIKWIKPYMEQTASNAVVPILNKKDFSNIHIALPSIETQKEIAHILDKIEQMRLWREESSELTNDYLSSFFLKMFGNPNNNLMKWKKCKVIEVVDCIVPGRDKPKTFSGEIPWITTEDLDEQGKTIFSKKGLGLSANEIKQVRAKIVPKNSVLMTCVGDLGIISIAGKDIVINQQLHSFQCSEKINNIFLMYCLSFLKSEMYKVATSTTVPYMNKTNCNNLSIILPSIERQNEFSVIFEKIAEMKKLQYKSQIEIETLSKVMNQKLFKGEIKIDRLKIKIKN